MIQLMLVTACSENRSQASRSAEEGQDASPPVSEDAQERCDPPPMRATYLPWLRPGQEPSAPRERWDGSNALLTWSGPREKDRITLVRHFAEGDLDLETKSVKVGGTKGWLVWVGDPGVGELMLAWTEGSGICSGYSLHLETVGLTESDAEREIRRVGDGLTDVGNSVESSPPGTATDEDKRLIRALIRFARSPGPETIAGVPFAEDGVWLGLADRLVTRRTTKQLVEPEAWALQVELFRAYAGPFSALDHLAGFKKTTVSVGPHPHCVSPPMPPPKKVADLRRVSVQPTDYQSCLQWSTVDVFVTPDGEVLAVTVDFWEP